MEHNSFCSILKFCHPSLLDRDIPRHHTICTEIVWHAEIAEERVHEKLKNIPSRISFTFDTWTSAPRDPYLLLTAHFIDAPADHPNTRELKSDQLIFQEIKGRHTGNNMGDILGCVLDRYNLCGKVMSSCYSLYIRPLP